MTAPRRIPPPTDAELDSRNGGYAGGHWPANGAPVTLATLARVDEALRWHERRAKEAPR
jgi:hypothetical protein